MKIFKTKLNKRLLIAFAAALIGIASFSVFNVNVKEVFSYAVSKERKLPIYCVKTDEKKISISFDAAWGADDTDELLKILKENDVKTTFFMCGYWVDDYPQEVMKIFLSGHDLANHSATHPHMSQLTKEQIKKEIMETHNKVYELTGYEMDLFRPPFGEYDNKVIEGADETGYYTVQWDVDSLETKIISRLFL